LKEFHRTSGKSLPQYFAKKMERKYLTLTDLCTKIILSWQDISVYQGAWAKKEAVLMGLSVLKDCQSSKAVSV